MNSSAEKPIIVRRALFDDSGAIAVLNTEVQALHSSLVPELFKPPGDATLDEDAIRQLLAGPENVILLALATETPVGYLYAEIRRRGENSYRYAYDEIYLHHVSVLASHRRRGIGSALLDAINHEGRDLGISRLALDVWTANDAAAAFFRKHGFAAYNERLARGGWGTTRDRAL